MSRGRRSRFAEERFMNSGGEGRERRGGEGGRERGRERERG